MLVIINTKVFFYFYHLWITIFIVFFPFIQLSLINSHLVACFATLRILSATRKNRRYQRIEGKKKKSEKRSKAGYRVRRRVVHTRGTCLLVLFAQNTGRENGRKKKKKKKKKIRERIELARVVERKKKKKKKKYVLAGETSVKRDRRVESREHAILLGT